MMVSKHGIVPSPEYISIQKPTKNLLSQEQPLSTYKPSRKFTNEAA